MGLLALLACYYAFQAIALAESPEGLSETEQELAKQAVLEIQNESLPFGSLKASEKRELTSWNMPISAYNSVAWQTDSTPCIGAAGTNICNAYERGQNVCAANFVPLGTELYVDGLGVCTVLDRMNARYYYKVDWFMSYDIHAARQFGVRTRNVSVISG